MDGKDLAIVEHQKQCGLKARQQQQRFSNFEVLPGNKDAYEAAKAFVDRHCETPKERGMGLLLMGPVGSCKTHTAAAIANHEIDGWRFEISPERVRDLEDSGYTHSGWNYRDNPPKIKFTSVVDMLSTIRAAYDGEDDVQDVIWRFCNTDLLILDDMGTEKLTEWGSERLFEIVDHRYNENLPMIITTNLTPAQLKKAVGDRIYDRIREVCRMVSITEGSYRPTA